MYLVSTKEINISETFSHFSLKKRKLQPKLILWLSLVLWSSWLFLSYNIGFTFSTTSMDIHGQKFSGQFTRRKKIEVKMSKCNIFQRFNFNNFITYELNFGLHMIVSLKLILSPIFLFKIK